LRTQEPAGAAMLWQTTDRASWGASSMLVSVLITFLVIILVLYLINMLPIDARAKQIARVVVIILGVISLLKYIAVF
jgi:Na+/melibiose symporter-like transporter